MKRLEQELEKHGYKARIVSVHHVQDLREEVEEKHRKGQFCEEFYLERLNGFSFSPPDSLPEAKSLIIVAFPQPQLRVTFKWNRKTSPITIPPTYLHYPDEEVENILEQILGPQDWLIARASLPLKLLAVRSGLGTYGRNNICYVPGMGSFHRLMAFFTDLPLAEDSWHQARMMESCQKCSACLRSCPSGAISSERFLLHAELCLTFHNERASNFPPWINSSWHHCLVGCMSCQKACPENKDCQGWFEEREGFSEEETNIILKNVSCGERPPETVKKLERLDLVEYLEVLPRNLRVLLQG